MSRRDRLMIESLGRCQLPVLGYPCARSRWHLGACEPSAAHREMILAEQRGRSCGSCGKGEADGVGIIIDGQCSDCRRAWG